MTEIPTSTADDPADEQVSFEPPVHESNGAATQAVQHETPDAPPTATADTADVADPVTKRSSRRRRMNNPVVWREMHTRFDSLGTAAVISIFVLLIGLPSVAVYAASLDSDYALLSLGRNGVTLFESTLLMMLGLVMLVAPLQASGAIAVERDRQTLMPMQISLLRPWQIALGKIRVATTFSMYLLLLAAPILAIAWSVGSVSVGRLIMGLIMLLATVVFATTVTVFFSSLTRRSIAAAFMAYVVLGAIIIGPTIGFFVIHGLDAARGEDEVRAPKVLLATNPVMALATAVGKTDGSNGEDVQFDQFGNVSGFGGPLTSLKESLIREQDGVLGNNGDMIEEGFNIGTLPPGTIPEGVLFNPQTGLPFIGENGEPLPDDGTLEITILDTGAVAVLDSNGEEVPLGQADGDAEAGIAVASTVAVGGDVVGGQRATSIGGIPLWLEYLVFVALISALAAWATTRRLRTPAATER